MIAPPNLKRRSDAMAESIDPGQSLLEPTHIYIEQPHFDFTELFLSESEMDGLCVIPSRRAAARWMPAQRLGVVPRVPRKSRSLQAVVAAGMAWLMLPGCKSVEQPRTEPTAVEAVRPAQAPRVKLQVEQVLTAHRLSVPAHEELFQISTARYGRTPRLASRPAPAVNEAALLDKARKAMDGGQYKSALAIYKNVLHRDPTQADALFGAALALHELREVKSADVFLKKALTAQPNHPLANILAGFTDQMGHRYASAREHYARFLSVESEGDRADEIRAVLGTIPRAAGGTVTGGR